MSATGPAAIIDPWILQHSVRLIFGVPQPDGGWDVNFPSSNILDPHPKVKAKAANGVTSAWFTVDTAALLSGIPLRFDVFSILFVEGIQINTTTIRVRGGNINGTWANDTGQQIIWPFSGVTEGNASPKLPEFYNPPGIHMHVYLGASAWLLQNQFVRFDFGSLVSDGRFRIGGAACDRALVMPAEFGSSAATPVEESEDLWTWGDERMVRPGPKYDRKDWQIFLTRQQKEQEAYMTLKRRGSSSPIIAVDELPAPLPASNDEPWTRHQGTIYGTITGVSPLVRAAPNLFRSRIDFQEL